MSENIISNLTKDRDPFDRWDELDSEVQEYQEMGCVKSKLEHGTWNAKIEFVNEKRFTLGRFTELLNVSAAIRGCFKDTCQMREFCHKNGDLVNGVYRFFYGGKQANYLIRAVTSTDIARLSVHSIPKEVQ